MTVRSSVSNSEVVSGGHKPITLGGRSFSGDYAVLRFPTVQLHILLMSMKCYSMLINV